MGEQKRNQKKSGESGVAGVGITGQVSFIGSVKRIECGAMRPVAEPRRILSRSTRPAAATDGHPSLVLLYVSKSASVADPPPRRLRDATRRNATQRKSSSLPQASPRRILPRRNTSARLTCACRITSRHNDTSPFGPLHRRYHRHCHRHRPRPRPCRHRPGTPLTIHVDVINTRPQASVVPPSPCTPSSNVVVPVVVVVIIVPR